MMRQFRIILRINYFNYTKVVNNCDSIICRHPDGAIRCIGDTSDPVTDEIVNIQAPLQHEFQRMMEMMQWKIARIY